MFLDDIERQINRQDKKEFWDKWAYFDLNSEELAVPLLDGIKLLYVKNVGSIAVNLDANKLKIKLLSGEEKYLVRTGGTQLIIYPLGMAGRIFVAQSKRESTNIIHGFAIAAALLCWSFTSFAGCGSLQAKYENKNLQKGESFLLTPAMPQAAQLPKTPKTPTQ